METPAEVIQEYVEIIDEVYGTYLDSIKGFVYNKSEMERIQQQNIEELHVTLEYLDTVPMTYGKGAPGDPSTYILHNCTQKEYKERNSKGGKNFITLANLCVTQLYQYWEDYYRDRIAKSLGQEKSVLAIDIFGDLRLIRHSIIHHQAIALPEISKCKVLTWFKHNDQICLSEDQVEQIIFGLKKEMALLLS